MATGYSASRTTPTRAETPPVFQSCRTASCRPGSCRRKPLNTAPASLDDTTPTRPITPESSRQHRFAGEWDLAARRAARSGVAQWVSAPQGWVNLGAITDGCDQFCHGEVGTVAPLRKDPEIRDRIRLRQGTPQRKRGGELPDTTTGK